MRVTATAGSETAIGCRAVTPSDARSASGHHTTIAMISSVNAAVTSGYQVDAPGTEEENCGQVNTTIADTSAQVETMARLARVMSERYHTPIRAPAGGPPERARTRMRSYGAFRAKRQTADQGRLPCGPSESGSIATMRSDNGRRASFAAVLSSGRTSIGCHPCAVKNGGPSDGANRNGAPASFIASPIDCFIISTSPGDARSSAQCWKLGGAARSLASDATASAMR